MQDALSRRGVAVTIDLVRIHVLWAPASTEGARIAELISRHFDGIGMERDGVAYRLPVRFRSEPWELDSRTPRPIDLDQAEHNVVVLLHDLDMHLVRADWDAYVRATRAAMKTRGGADAYVPFGSPDGNAPLTGDAADGLQYARRDKWNDLPSPDAGNSRLLLHLLNAMREHLRKVRGSANEPEPLFVSHAKADGDGIARAIIEYVNATEQDVRLKTFYDAKELTPGDEYEEEFVKTISKGTLLAIVSDIYDSRPWCVFELTTAKRARRPIVLADVGKVRTSRTYPYGANLPRVRILPRPGETAWIETLLVQTLSEGLRCDVFNVQAARILATTGHEDALVLPRPPELFDLVEREPLPPWVVYPDPPLGRLEAEILQSAVARLGTGVVIVPLSEVR